MFSKKNIFILLGIISLGIGFWYADRHLLRLNQHWIYIERADTVAAQEVGLGERDFLCADCGMIFDFPKLDRYDFWMRGMRFPLDIVWIADHRVVFIEKNIPAKSGDIFTSPDEADQVLEINAGKADEWGIHVGDIIK